MDISFIIKVILKAVLYYTWIHHPGLSSQMAVAPHSPLLCFVSFDIILDSNTRTYNTQLEQGAMDSSQVNQFLSNLLLDLYSHCVHQNKSMECQDLETQA